MTTVVPVPLRLHETQVCAEWVDYNGHMSEACYLEATGQAVDVFFRLLGIDDAYRAAGRSVFTRESHVHYVSEARLGEHLVVTLRMIDRDDRRMHIYCEILRNGELVAAVEQLLVHVDLGVRRSQPFPDDVRARLEDVFATHHQAPAPSLARGSIGIRRPAAAPSSQKSSV